MVLLPLTYIVGFVFQYFTKVAFQATRRAASWNQCQSLHGGVYKSLALHTFCTLLCLPGWGHLPGDGQWVCLFGEQPADSSSSSQFSPPEGLAEVSRCTIPHPCYRFESTTTAPDSPTFPTVCLRYL